MRETTLLLTQYEFSQRYQEENVLQWDGAFRFTHDMHDVSFILV